MRVVLLDTNNAVNGKATYDLGMTRNHFKRLRTIKLLKHRTTAENVKNIDKDNIIGHIEHIKPHNGVFRGDVIANSPMNEDFLIKYFDNKGKVRLAINIDGLKDPDTGIIEVKYIHEIYYAYLLPIKGEKENE